MTGAGQVLPFAPAADAAASAVATSYLQQQVLDEDAAAGLQLQQLRAYQQPDLEIRASRTLRTVPCPGIRASSYIPLCEFTRAVLGAAPTPILTNRGFEVCYFRLRLGM